MSRRRIIIDTDPGVDDAVAIMLALASPELEVLGLTSVCGNVALAHTTRNARRLVELSGRNDVVVAEGAATPLVYPAGDASEVHGQDGLGDLTWDEPATPLSDLTAIDFIYQSAQSTPLTLVAIGPLTNLALLLRRYPEVTSRIEEVVIMGGASLEGNVTAAAEFNIWADPEAAAVVFGADWPITFMPLDLTHQATLTEDVVAQIGALGNEVGRRLCAMLQPYANFHEEWHGSRDVIMHDAMAIYELIDREAITKIGVHVDVETGGHFSRGATLIARGPAHASSRTRVGVTLDNNKFVALLLERLATY